MTTSGQDVYRLLYEKSPAWLASLELLTGDNGRRKNSLVDSLRTPELSAHGATTLDTEASTAVTSSPTERRDAQGSNAPISTANTLPSGGAQLRTVQHATPSVWKQDSAQNNVVLYNAQAQNSLADIVKEVGRVSYAIKKCQQRNMFDDTLKKLNRAAEMCEDGAFQLLREGHCRHHAGSATTIFEHLFRISCSEVMHDQMTARLGTPEKTLPPPPPQLHSLSVPYIPVDSAEDDEATIDLRLPPIRLTSRQGR